MRKIIFMVLGLLFLLVSCAGNDALDKNKITKTSPPEITIINDTPNDVWNPKAPPPEIPVINDYPRDEDNESYMVDYAYLTDMLLTTPTTLVQKGDMFLDWKAEYIEVVFHKYDDGSISYWSALIEFAGETEIRARLEYYKYDPQTGFGGSIFVAVHEESKHLIPNLANRHDRTHYFMIYMDETDERFAEIFSGADGCIIEDCKIVISDYRIVFAFTDAHDTASFVEIKR